MKACRRIFALLVLVCLVIPMCLISVSADTHEPVTYSLYDGEMKNWEFNSKGLVTFKSKSEEMANLYAQKNLNIFPYAYSSKASFYINHGENASYAYSGPLGLKFAVGDWMALKFRSPGSGYFSLNLNAYYHNANNAGTFSAYLLPGTTATTMVGSKLTKDNKLGNIQLLNDNANKQQVVSLSCTTGVELEAGKDYILVIQTDSDLYNEDNRVDMMFTGLTIDKGYEKPEGAFDAVMSELVYPNIIKAAEFYDAITGVNPENGHDLMFLLFKGGMMIVYDMDTKSIHDVRYDLHNTPFGQCFDPDGNLWLCGQGSFLYKYNPATKELEKFTFAYDLFGGKKTNAYGILYGDDGYIYFTYWSWIGRFDPKTKEFINLSGDALNPEADQGKESDSQFSGHGGMIYKNGYLYLNCHGDLNGDKLKTSYMIQFDIAQRKIVDKIDILPSTVNSNYGIVDLSLVGNLLVGTFGNRQIPIYIDITDDKMVRQESIEGIDTCFNNLFTDPVDGKVYATGYVDNESTNKCVYEYDLATKTAKRLGDIMFLASFRAEGATVTIEGDAKLPGTSLVTALNNTATGMVDLIFYNIETRETVIWEGISMGYGSGMSMRALITDPTGRYLYAGAYGTNQVVRYDIETGEIHTVPTLNHQTDSLAWYKDMIWIGNYSIGSLLRLDPETDEVKSILTLGESVFKQYRMFAITTGDNKVFVGSVPATNRVGGVLAWYDIEADLTYIAAGPNPEDVYYARTTGSFTVWRDVLTNTVHTFDDDGDTLPDPDILIDDLGDDDPNNDLKKQKFYGAIPYQCIVHMYYKDGYIFGTTTRAGGQAANVDAYTENAKLFVYDVDAMQVVSTCDVGDYISGLEDPETGYIQFIDFLEEDPYEEGKFWGVICDTLFSCSFDYETMQFVNVKEELSMAKGKAYKGTDWFDKEVIFDGEYMYLSFHNFGAFMINTSNVAECFQLTPSVPTEMSLAADGNLYYFSLITDSSYDLRVIPIGESTQPLVAKSVQALIDALPDTITAEHSAQVMTVYKMYGDLLEITKPSVNTQKLDAAVQALSGDWAAKADQMIDAIGEVTLQSDVAIKNARDYYEALPESAKAGVTKLSVLEAAESKLLELKIAKPGSDKPAPEQNTAPENNGLIIVIIAVAAVVVIAGVVIALLISKKKKSSKEA